MRWSLTISVTLVAVATCQSVQAAELIPVAPIQGSTFMSAYDVNDNNIITGYYGTSDGHQHAYFGPWTGPYTVFDFGNTYTQARGINDAGYITGVADVNGMRTQFERSPDGQITVITKDGNPITLEYLQGINSQGVFVGNYRDANNRQKAYYGQNGQYLKDFTLPNGSPAQPRGINDAGDVSGSSGYDAFILKGDVATFVDAITPTQSFTAFEGINKKGTLVSGYWIDVNFTRDHPVLFDTQRNAVMPIEIPGSSNAVALGMNGAGLVAIASDIGPFIYCPYPKGSRKCPAGGIDVPDPVPLRAAVRHVRVVDK